MKKVKMTFPDGSVKEVDEADVATAQSIGGKLFSEASKSTSMVFPDGTIKDVENADTSIAQSLGAKKKVGGVGIGTPAEADTITKQPAGSSKLDWEMQESGFYGPPKAVEQPKVSVFDNPELDPLKRFNEGEMAGAVPPAPKKKPVDILRDDYYANKVSVDKSLTSTVGDDEAFGKYVQGDSLINAVTDTRNPDPRLLEKYSKKRNKDLDNELLAGKEALDAKYPQPKATNLGMGVFQQPKRPDEYYAELDALGQEIDARKKEISDAVWEVAAVKNYSKELHKVAEPKFVNKDMARYMRRAMGDPTLEREERYEVKGIPLSPAEKYYNDKLGYLAKATVLKQMTDNGVDILNNPAAKQLFDNVKDGKEKLLADNKDFTRQQAARLISDKISQDKNWFQLMTGAYTINDKDIKKYAKQLNIPDDIADQVHEGDIHTSNILGEFTNELAARPGAQIATAVGRVFRREVLGQDPDAIDAHYEALNKKFTTFLADAPDAQTLFSNPTEIQSDVTKDNFLEDQRNAKQGKFNWSIPAIANSIANGAGQMIQYGLGASALGGGLKAVGAIRNIEKAKDVGLVTYGFLTSYESGYQRARELVGDDPKKEAQRNIIGAIWASIQAGSELIFKDYKVTDKLFSVKNPGSVQLLELLGKAKAEDAAKVLASATGKKTLAKAIMEGVVKTAKGTAEEIGEEEAANIGDLAIAMVTNKKDAQDRNIPEEFLQTAVQTALSAIIPIGIGEMRAGRHTSGINKAMVHEIGADPDTYISHISKEAADGKIPQPLANKRISIVNTMADIVQKAVPPVSPITGNQLSEKNKIDYSYNLLHTSMLNEKLELDKKTDPVQEKITEGKLKELAEERVAILQNADGIEKNFNGQPIYERDQKPAPTQEEQQKDIEEGKTATFVYDNESQVPDVFKDKISSTGENNGKKFVRVTVAQNLADYELSKNQQRPETEIKVPAKETDYTGKDNTFLSKDPTFFTPTEREAYNELMKKPETEAQAAKMIEDKKTELKNFATPPIEEAEQPEASPKVEEIKPEEATVPVPEAHAETYRTDEQASKIINEKLNKPSDFVKKFKTNVDYQDIVTGETKNDKVYKAQKEMADRYNKVHDLIVNCLS